jgi:1-acyl-sn-glycerol-3-phosphate acyltransferase
MIRYFSSVFYSLLKSYARLAIKIYLRRIIINKPEVLKKKGPLLLAANHPNSFLDGIILTTLFDHPVHSLARGDVFKRKWLDRFLRSIRLLPVYRTSEGAENLGHNYTTFAACQETFEKKEVVLIFSEGRCENEWHLRPLKKGTARLAITAWENQLPLEVLPTAFNYSSFSNFGKEVHLYFGEPILPSAVIEEPTEGKKLVRFNELLKEELQQMVYEIDASDQTTIRKMFSIKKDKSFYALLVPGILGALLHAPLFFPCKFFASRFKKTDHYDSVLTSLLLLLYPIYLTVCLLAAFIMHETYLAYAVILMPFTAWAAVRLKYQLGV